MAAVRRIRRPGCKFDEIVVLVSEKQGTNKSSALRKLAKKDRWFTDSFPLRRGTDDKKIIEQTRGKWIVECSELAGMKHADVEDLKGQLSRQADRSRMAYGHDPIEVPRQFVAFASTNNEEFLRDVENRRYLPVVIIRFDLEKLGPDVDQLWAEAATMESADPTDDAIRLPEELWLAAAEVQDQHKVQDSWAVYLNEVIGHFKHGKIWTTDLFKILGKPVERQSVADGMRLRDVMVGDLRWSKSKSKFRHGGSAPNRGYYIGSKDTAPFLVVTRDPNNGDIFVSPAPEEGSYEKREQADASYEPRTDDAPPPSDEQDDDEDIPF
jgi:predicted P-loop ATPase